MLRVDEQGLNNLDGYKSIASFQPHNRARTSDEPKRKKVDGKRIGSLDLFSTSPTYASDKSSRPDLGLCIYRAPFFAYCQHDKTYVVVQGCCNHWDCPRCGLQRAKEEYGRIIEGIKSLSETNDIWFITITCKGKEISYEEADENYGKWTNKLLDAWRLQSKRTNQKWAYVQVTERQKRGHPHSHILTTFHPLDLAIDWKEKRVSVEGATFMAYVSCYRSGYIAASVIRAGLGEQYDISQARTAGGASRYVAKYLFKDSIFNTSWPKGWKRVRYSQSFPKREPYKSDAFVLIKPEHWKELASRALLVKPIGGAALEECQWSLRGSDVLIDMGD